jgi:hypothetical protein
MKKFIARIKLTGTVYKTLGFGFSLGQPSKIARNELEDIPFESVSTSVVYSVSTVRSVCVSSFVIGQGLI